MTSARTDVASFLRGKLHMAGIDRSSPIQVAVDVLQVLVMDVPADDLKKWRREMDAAMWKVRPPDRATWGLRPDQQQETERLLGGPSPRVADSRASTPATPSRHGGVQPPASSRGPARPRM